MHLYLFSKIWALWAAQVDPRTSSAQGIIFIDLQFIFLGFLCISLIIDAVGSPGRSQSQLSSAQHTMFIEFHLVSLCFIDFG